MYKRSQLSPTLSLRSDNDSTISSQRFEEGPATVMPVVKVTTRRLNGQSHFGTSSSAGLSSIADTSNEMDELPVSSHTHGKLQKRGKLVTFFRNGDRHFKGITIPISQKWFITLETLIMYLNEKISTPTGIRHIFNLESALEVKDVREFQPGQNYIVSSVRSLVQETIYGTSFEKYWLNKPLSGGKTRKNDQYLFMKNYEDTDQILTSLQSVRDQTSLHIPTPRQMTLRKKPPGRKIKIISNTDRHCSFEIFVERDSDKKYEDLLYDLSEMFDGSSKPIQTLYTTSKPHTRVCSHLQLFREFLHEKEFIACGPEFYPVELRKRVKEGLKIEKVYAFSSDSVDSGVFTSNRSCMTKETQTDAGLIPESTKRETHSNIPKKPKGNSPRYLTIRSKERVFYPPDTQRSKTLKPSAPLYRLHLNWIYGINSSVFGNCIQAVSSDEFLYSVNKVFIVYNVTDFSQRYFLEHTANISCFSIHQNRRYVASAQDGNDSESQVYVWDVGDCSVLQVLTTGSRGAMYSLDFSKEGLGEYVLILEADADSRVQSMLIYDWRKGVKVTSTKCNREKVLEARFHQDDNTTVVSFGYQHLNVWRVFWKEKGEAKILRDKKSGLFDFCIPESVSCVTFDLIGNLLSGDSNGSIYLWARDEEDAFVNRTVPQLFHAHKDVVACLLLIGDGTVISASRGSIKAWDSFNDFRFVKERNITPNLGCIKTMVAAHPEKIDGKLWICTDRSTILEGNLQDPFMVVFQCHGDGSQPLRLAASPNEHCFATGGLDKEIVKWSILQQRPTWRTVVDSAVTALCYHPEGVYLALGTASGSLVILRSKSGANVMSLQIDPSQKPLSCLQYSPDGKLLAVCPSNDDLRMLAVHDSGAFYRSIPEMQFKNSKAIHTLDWSKNCHVVRTEDMDLTPRLWSLHPTVKETSINERSQYDFATDNCLVTYTNYDLWKSQATGEVTSTKASLNGLLMAYGTSLGSVGLKAKVCVREEADVAGVPISVGPVKDVNLSFDDTFLLHTSIEQGCPIIVQWKVEEE